MAKTRDRGKPVGLVKFTRVDPERGKVVERVNVYEDDDPDQVLADARAQYAPVEE